MEKYLQDNARVLDWGCGNGAFVRAAQNGFYSVGHDINPCSPYKAVDALDEPWDAVTMWDVLEHMHHPDKFLKSIDTTFIFVVTPDVRDAGRDIASWKHFRPDEHQHYFTVSSLATLFEKTGYRVLEINRDEAKIRDSNHPNGLITMVGAKVGR